ncbi:mediator of RNA polymerase II transcription subunit 8 [Pyrus ussuriensis x Pyrus communis]|uniref:Mediator of RNA polymerase II transcription subunit 8 n=1 Tax=Pyrus ussuriensis x Pyrus communis TaxID=2448454 RepID=A0A5N5GFQ7_9ROSA|nr:mediator of RNA polymerase II transcription subunit 8 [Pyrus ussuriensis x Pyrus communis]
MGSHIHAGLRLPGDQRQNAPGLPMHLVDVLSIGGVQAYSEASGNNQLGFVVQSATYWKEASSRSSVPTIASVTMLKLLPQLNGEDF